MRPTEREHPGFRHLFSGSLLPPMSLRNRIAFYYTVTTAILMALVFAAILFSIDRIIYLHFDQDLRHEAAETLQEARLNGRLFFEQDGFNVRERDLENSDGNQTSIDTLHTDSGFVQLVDRKGRIVSKSINLISHTLAFNSAYSGVRYFNSLVGTAPVRAIQVPLIGKNSVLEGWLVVAVPTSNIISIFLDLRNVMLASFPVIILFQFVLTRAIAGRSIRPVEEIIIAAEKMSQENFSDRIPLPRKHDELYRLSQTINALLDRLQEAFQREKNFTSDASHELRTPLSVVKGTLDVLVRKHRAVEQYEEKIRYCLEELNRMARLIDQLLVMARCDQESAKPKIEPTELSSVIKAVLSRLAPLAESRQISFACVNLPEAMVAADPAMLEMILENIVTNAVKFSRPASFVEVALTRSSDMVLCTITDHGIGIPEDKLPQVFERFYRVDESRSSGTGGSGIGLSIVRKLADLQNIGISVSSLEHEGTSFRLAFRAI